MAIIDICVLVFIGIFVIIGVIKGLTKSVLSLISLILVFYLASVLCGPVAGFLEDNYGDRANEKFSEWIVALCEPGSPERQVLTTKQDWTKQENVDVMMDAFGVPGVLEGRFKDVIYSAVGDYGSHFVASDVLAIKFSPIFLSCIAYLALCVVIGIVLLIIRVVILRAINSSPFLKAIDKIAGFALGLAKGLLIVSVVYVLIMFLPVGFLDPIRDFVSEQIQKSSEGVGITAWIAENPIVTFIQDKFFAK